MLAFATVPGGPRLADFEALAVPLLPDLYRAAVSLLRNAAEAEDLVQDTFLHAWKSFHRFELGTNIRAWMFKILFNRAHHTRRKWFRVRLLKEEEEFVVEQLVAEEPIQDHLTDDEILGALDDLAPEYREVILLADVEEFTYREIADMTEVPIGTVMSRLNRARKKLRDSLGERARQEGIRNLRDRGEYSA